MKSPSPVSISFPAGKGYGGSKESVAAKPTTAESDRDRLAGADRQVGFAVNHFHLLFIQVEKSVGYV